jgi:hypothetical protein
LQVPPLPPTRSPQPRASPETRPTWPAAPLLWTSWTRPSTATPSAFCGAATGYSSASATTAGFPQPWSVWLTSPSLETPWPRPTPPSRRHRHETIAALVWSHQMPRPPPSWPFVTIVASRRSSLYIPSRWALRLHHPCTLAMPHRLVEPLFSPPLAPLPVPRGSPHQPPPWSSQPFATSFSGVALSPPQVVIVPDASNHTTPHFDHISFPSSSVHPYSIIVGNGFVLSVV